MATTTNYGWETPDDTDLVKDGALASRTLGSSIDTTVKNLNPETTLGDIAYRSSTANVKTRLGLGTAGQVLTVNSGATAPEWATVSAGGMTLLSTTTLSGSSVTVSSISGSYTDLVVEMRNVRSSSDDRTIIIRFNSDTGSNYGFSNVWNNVGSLTGTSGTSTNIFIGKSNSSTTTLTLGQISVRIPLYSNTSYRKALSYGWNSRNPGGEQSGVGYARWDSTSAIDSITVAPDGDSFSAGTMLIYGVK